MYSYVRRCSWRRGANRGRVAGEAGCDRGGPRPARYTRGVQYMRGFMVVQKGSAAEERIVVAVRRRSRTGKQALDDPVNRSSAPSSLDPLWGGTGSYE